MSRIIDRRRRIPAYLQLYEKMKRDITEGVFPPGTKLPSKRVAAERAGVSEITVRHAYDLLADEGYIEMRERSGCFVTFTKDGGFARSADGALPSARGKKKVRQKEFLFPLSVLTKTMRSVMVGRGEAILEKSPNWGLLELRAAIAAYLARNRGIRVKSSQIIIGSGAEYLYGLVASAFGRETVFALESPSYEKIEQVYLSEGARCELLPLKADGIDSAALASSKAGVLHITPYRSYPSGITAPASKRYEYIGWADKGGRFIIEDDFESEFSVSHKPEETLFSLSKQGRVIYINTFSKTISPSLRAGYMVIPKRALALFRKKTGFFSCTVPTFEQLVLAKLIQSGDFERHINRVRRIKRKEEAELA